MSKAGKKIKGSAEGLNGRKNKWNGIKDFKNVIRYLDCYDFVLFTYRLFQSIEIQYRNPDTECPSVGNYRNTEIDDPWPNTEYRCHRTKKKDKIPNSSSGDTDVKPAGRRIYTL